MFYLANKSDDHVKASYKDLTGIYVNGFSVIPVPDDVDVDPTDIANPPEFSREDVVRQKYEGILSNHSSFDYVIDDDLMNLTVDSASRVAQGGYTIWMPPEDSAGNEGHLRINMTTSQGQFSDFMVHWDLYHINKVSQNGRNFKKYVEVDPDTVNLSISNDNGSSFKPASFKETVSFSSAGDSIVLDFKNHSTSDRYYLGGVALFY